VQGVGFRFFVLRNARELGLSGRVRNRPDGDVEVWAHGPRSKLQVLEALLRQGPPMSQVDHVAVIWGVKVEPQDDFIIGF
jgi:acylphosphatase